MRTVRLKAGHVQPVWAGHPWVYAQAIEWIEGPGQDWLGLFAEQRAARDLEVISGVSS